MLACQIGGCKNTLDGGTIVLIVIGSIILIILIAYILSKVMKGKKE